jgi:exopolysaccharide biosynthesis polyprenyl glycosylphosphotransferase
MKAGVNSRDILEIPNKIPGKILKRSAYKSWEWYILLPTLIVNDLFFYILSFRLAYWIRYESNWPITQFWFRPAIDYSQLRLLTIPVFIVIFTMVGLYNRRNLLGGTREYSLVFSGTTIAMFINICVGFLFPDEMVLARGWVVLTWLLSSILISAGRFIIRRIIYRLRYSGLFQNPTIIVGSNTEASLVTEQLLNAKTSGLKVVGYINCGNFSSGIPENLTCFGQLEDLQIAIRTFRIPVVILISSALSRDQVVDIFRKFGTSKNVDLRMSTGLFEIITTGLEVKEDGMVPLVAINNVRLTGIDQIFKLILDYCIVIPAAIILMPFFFIVGILIKIDSPGPVIHFRRVMGVNGRQFNAYKFRTMYINGDEILSSHPELIDEYQSAFKLKSDPRVTRLGKFLRKTSIDELPQIFNIIKNQMSVVGPRMICPDELEKYDQWDINLLTVKPGLTGLSQIRGRANLSYEKRVQFDMYYIRNWTIWMDLQIILQTIPAVIFRRGAY